MQFAVSALRQLDARHWSVEAADADDARRQGEQQGWQVLSVKLQRRGLAWARLRRDRFPLLQFSQSLLLLLQAGLSITEAISALAERETRADIRQVLSKLEAQIRDGQPLSVALERQAAVFSPLFIAGIKANERTGALAEAIERFIAYQAQADLLRKRIVSASIYPAMILAVGGLVIAFLLFYVVPRFSIVFQDMGDRIPALSRLLLDWGRFVHEHGVQVGGGVLALVAAGAFALTRAPVRDALVRRVQALPRLGEYARTYQLARFYRALGMLLRSGIAIVPALDMSIGMLPPVMHARLAAARREIVEGRTLSSGFELHGLTTAISLRLLRVGERTGQMGDMLERSARFHDEDIAQAIDWFLRVFEPLLMIVIGIVIGAVVLLMYAPIFELAGSIQ